MVQSFIRGELKDSECRKEGRSQLRALYREIDIGIWIFLYTFHFAFLVAKTHLRENVFRTPCYDQLFIMLRATLMFYLVIFYLLFQLQNKRLLTSLREFAFMKTKALFISNTQHNFDRHTSRGNKQEVAL
jgi:hypothetical protein